MLLVALKSHDGFTSKPGVQLQNKLTDELYVIGVLELEKLDYLDRF